jgi:hypothetical protein
MVSMKRFLAVIYILFFLPQQAWCFANTDTIKSSEYPALIKGYLSSSGYYYFKADSCSKKRDSSCAGKYLLQVNPYYLLWSWRNSTAPDTFLSKMFLNSKVKEECLGRYNEVLNAKKSQSYETFERMANEDQQIRSLMEKCGDTNTCKKLSRKMFETDTAHFSFLYHYVSTNGWPTLQDGSLYATLLAIHDHAHHNFYMPFLKREVYNGRMSIQAIDLIDNYLRETPSSQMLARLLTEATYRFNIGEIIDLKLPASLSRIQNALKQVCPYKFQYYYICTYPDLKNIPAALEPNRLRTIMEKFQEELRPYCSKKRVLPEEWFIHYLVGEKFQLFMVINVLEDS